MRPIMKKANLSSISTTGLWAPQMHNTAASTYRPNTGSPFVGVKLELRGPTAQVQVTSCSQNDLGMRLMLSSTVIERESAGNLVRARRAASDECKKRSNLLMRSPLAFEYTYAGELRAILSRIAENTFSRSVHVANLHHNSVRYNLGIDDELDFTMKADLQHAVNHWKERWLLPYLHRDEKALKKSIKRLHKMDLSSVYPPSTTRSSHDWQRPGSASFAGFFASSRERNAPRWTHQEEVYQHVEQEVKFTEKQLSLHVQRPGRSSSTGNTT